MKLPKKPRTFLTGGGSGLGKALALELARSGGRICVADVNLAAADTTAREVEAAGGEAFALRCDVTSASAVEAAALALEQRFGGVDLVVNNAGVAAGGAVGEFPLEDWEWILRVNLWGVVNGCHVFVPRLKAQGSGFILNVASAAGIASLPEMAAYNVTKAGVIALSETLYGELGGAGVQVGVLCPTFFKTNLMDSFRSPSPRQRELAEALFRRSKITAREIAREALKGLERGELHILPDREARLVWRVKRWLTGTYFETVRNKHQKMLQRMLRRDAA